MDRQNKKNKNCDIVKDLIPLYIDGVASDGSSELIKKHVETCGECKLELDISKPPLLKEKNIEDSVKYIKAFKEIKRRKRKVIYTEVGICVFIVFIIFSIFYFFYAREMYGNVLSAKVELGSSEKYSKAEIKEASETVKRYFRKNFSKCKMLTLTYDEEYSTRHDDGEDVIIFLCDFHTNSRTVHATFSEDETYKNYNFIVKYNKKQGKWKVISCGYG